MITTKTSLLLMLIAAPTAIIFTSHTRPTDTEIAILTARQITLEAAKSACSTALLNHAPVLYDALHVTEAEDVLRAYYSDICEAPTATAVRDVIDQIAQDPMLTQLQICLDAKQTIKATEPRNAFFNALCKIKFALELLVQEEKNEAFNRLAHNYQIATQTKACQLLQKTNDKSFSEYVQRLQQLAELDFNEACRQCCVHLEKQEDLQADEAQRRKELEENLRYQLLTKQALRRTTAPSKSEPYE